MPMRAPAVVWVVDTCSSRVQEKMSQKAAAIITHSMPYLRGRDSRKGGVRVMSGSLVGHSMRRLIVGRR